MLEAGATVPDFALQDDQGRTVRWSELRGKPVVVFAYPKANTPGCTKEACAFRDLGAEFAKRGVTVLGISGDSVKAQAKFRDAYGLSTPLLADPDRSVLMPWGIYGEKKMYGKTVQGIKRSTFLFDRDGVLRHVWPNVKVDGHAEAVLKKVDELFGA
jgi:peroxiredoxin Q/BCP